MDPERWKNLQFADTYLPTRDVSKQKENAQIMQLSKHLAIPLCTQKRPSELIVLILIITNEINQIAP